jgi:hypothetical protein
MFRLRFFPVLILMAIVALLMPDQRPAAAQTNVQTLACPAGAPITLTGNGPARAAFLLYFGSRAVSGGSVKADGHFSINLVVGRERAGNYPVVVRMRGASEILLELTCTVPGFIPVYAAGKAPTPIIVAAPTPTVAPIPIDHSGFATQGSPCPADYPIKGNINSKGEYIYHTDASRSYDRTIPERCFATEGDAQDAGYRAALDT